MRKNVDPFLYNVDSLDIHGLDRHSAVVMIKSFIDDMKRIDKKKFLIVHGHGEGILKKATLDYLKTDKRVLEYKLDMFNDGETIVYLK
jgi:DNA-nicking Smr family endonuclease